MELLMEIVNVGVYSVLGIVLMILGNFLIDLIVPCHFPTEIKKGNQAVGWLSAGSFIGIGMILRTAIMSPGGAGSRGRSDVRHFEQCSLFCSGDCLFYDRLCGG